VGCEAVAAQLAEKSLGHLAAAGIAGAEKQDVGF
jgi:hypothetical protein